MKLRLVVAALCLATVVATGLWIRADRGPRTHAAMPADPEDATPGNVLLVILDDVGVDRIGRYGLTDRVPPTPVLDRLAEHGVTFTNAYSNPSCTPTRVGILTGLHAMNHGIGTPLAPDEHGLPPRMWTLPEAIDELTGGTHAHAAIGKWHITSPSQGLDGPQRTGFQHFAGNISNLSIRRDETYRSWTRVEDGVEAQSHVYNTTDIVDSAARFIERTGDRPWFVWLAFNAAHVPFHQPPDRLVPPELRGARSEPDQFDAMVAAADRELGRLLRGLDPEVRKRTTVVLLGDNGTAREAVRPPTPRDRAKFSLFEGGVHVPMVIAGRGVTEPGREVRAPVSHVDLFPTILELLDGRLDEQQREGIDGVSLVPHLVDPDAAPVRTSVYAEEFHPNGTDLSKRQRWMRMVRDGRWKLIARGNGQVQLYRLEDGQDGDDLLVDGEAPDEETAEALARLRQLLRTEYAPR